MQCHFQVLSIVRLNETTLWRGACTDFQISVADIGFLIFWDWRKRVFWIGLFGWTLLHDIKFDRGLFALMIADRGFWFTETCIYVSVNILVNILYGNELNEDINPIQAGLSWALDKSRLKDKNLNCFQALSEEINTSQSIKRIGLSPVNKNMLRAQMTLHNENNEEIEKSFLVDRVRQRQWKNPFQPPLWWSELSFPTPQPVPEFSELARGLLFLLW